MGGENSAEERAEARAGASDALSVDLGPCGEPIDERLARRHPVLHREVQAGQRRLVLARTVDREHRHSTIEEPIAVKRDLAFLETVHAGNGDHRRDASAAIARRQMKPSRNCLVAERHPNCLDVVIRERCVFAVAFALLVVIGDIGFIVLIVRPLRGAPMDGRHEVVVARRHLAIGLLGRFRLRLAPARNCLEGGSDVGHLLDALTDAGEIGGSFDAARSVEIERAWLVPVDAVGADDVVDEPALLLEPAHMRLPALVQNRLGLADHVHHISPYSCSTMTSADVSECGRRCQ